MWNVQDRIEMHTEVLWGIAERHPFERHGRRREYELPHYAFSPVSSERQTQKPTVYEGERKSIISTFIDRQQMAAQGR